jgi:hypothetical protein
MGPHIEVWRMIIEVERELMIAKVQRRVHLADWESGSPRVAAAIRAWLKRLLPPWRRPAPQTSGSALLPPVLYRCYRECRTPAATAPAARARQAGRFGVCTARTARSRPRLAGNG